MDPGNSGKFLWRRVSFLCPRDVKLLSRKRVRRYPFLPPRKKRCAMRSMLLRCGCA